MEHKVITDQIKEEKIETIELVSYRSNTGKGKRRILKEKLAFEQNQVKVYQLFAKMIR
jgi:hypothetical protein